ncbi:MarR family winged helix-turn-helix transcriptional regulator [Actibacterium lipolyticum]|uniref:HTH-type transcriptional repressor NicR n=1 Tax=Actibacterium lipolyticum TaxID=1524263 RepID=A0A238LA57_9RHOB|nr:MarR family transcriptional regulator [Actibacterium lipolyticum]SMX51252.1 HTH-type transcriptional repressor NicR [Actibacterium lipolyticum]
MSREDGPDKLSLKDLPGHLLRRCHQISVGLFLEECEAFDLTPLQFAVLQNLINGGPQDQVTLAGRSALDRTTIAVVVSKLEGRGLVTRAQSEKDRRSKIVSITPKGRALAQSCAPAVLKAQTRTVAPLTDEEAETLITLLHKLADGNNAASRAPFKERKKAPV